MRQKSRFLAVALAVSALLCSTRIVLANSIGATRMSMEMQDVLRRAGKKPHPRLILTDNRLKELKELMKHDEFLKKCYRDVIKQADECCNLPLLKYRLPDSFRLLPVSRECLRRVYILGLAWRLTGKKKYAEKLKENLLTVCAFKDWNPPHFLDTAEMTHAVGIGYDWLYHYLDAQSREKIRAGLIKNGLKPGVSQYRGNGSWQVTNQFNWNLVCNSGLVVGALAVIDTDPKYADVIITGAVRFMPNALSTYAPDGAWPEGPGYWKYATDYAVYALSAMNTALGTDFGLSRMKGLSQTGFFPIYMTGPTGLYFNFADAGEEERRKQIPSLFWLAGRYDMPRIAQAEREMISRYGSTPQDFIWYVPARGKLPALPLDKYFRGPVEVAMFRNAWDDPNALFVAVKAGFNQVNHGHLDLGTFVLDALGVRWVRDLGCEDYNLPGYWAKGPRSKRWTYYRLTSLAHNIPVINGRNQDVYAETKIIKFKSTPKKGFAILDLTSAYKGYAKKMLRGVAIIDNRQAVLIQDEFQLEKPCDITWGITTDAKITVDKNKATLTIADKKMTVEVFTPTGATLTIKSAEQKPHRHSSQPHMGYRPTFTIFTIKSAEQKPPLKPNKGVKRLEIHLGKQKDNVRIAVIFIPHWPAGKMISPPKLSKLSPLSAW